MNDNRPSEIASSSRLNLHQERELAQAMKRKAPHTEISGSDSVDAT